MDEGDKSLVHLLDGIRVLLVHQEKWQDETAIAIKDSHYDSHGNYSKKRSGPTEGRSFRWANRGTFFSLAYDLIGNMISRTDPEDHTSNYGYDQLNRLVSVTNALNETTDYDYDRLGGLKSQTQYEGGAEFINSKGYDERGRLTSKSDPLGYPYSYQYNPRGFMSQQKDPEEQLFTYQYYNDSQLSQAVSGKIKYSKNGHQVQHPCW